MTFWATALQISTKMENTFALPSLVRPSAAEPCTEVQNVVYPASQDFCFPTPEEFERRYGWMFKSYDVQAHDPEHAKLVRQILGFRKSFDIRGTGFELRKFVKVFVREMRVAVYTDRDPHNMYIRVVNRFEQSRRDRAIRRVKLAAVRVANVAIVKKKTNRMTGAQRRAYQLMEHRIGVVCFQTGQSMAKKLRELREEKQRIAAKERLEAKRKEEPKQQREMRIKQQRDKRSPVFQAGGTVAGVLAGAGVVATTTLFHKLFKLLNKGDKLVDNANGFFTSLSKFKDKLKGLLGEVFWAFPLVVVGFYFINHMNNVGRQVKLLVVGAVGALLGPKLWNVIRDFFRVADDDSTGCESSNAEFQSGIPAISKLIATFMAFSIFQGKHSHHTVTEFAKRIALLDKVSVGWETFMNWALSAFESVFNYARKMVGKERIQLFKDSHRPLKAWASRVDKMMVRGPVEKKQVDPETIAEMTSLLREGTAFKELYRGTPMARLVEDTMCKAFALIQPYEGAINAQNNFRIEPEFVLFQGDPGIGKTLITVPLCTTILLMSGLIKPGSTSEDIISNIWSKGTSEFWNGYSTQKAIIFDDIFQARPDPTDKENEYISVIRAVSSWAMPLNFADLASKGKIYFNSPLLVGTCNNRSIVAPAALVLHEPQAVMRRITHPYRMRVRPEFMTNGRLDHLKYEEECVKALENDGLDKFPWHIWEVARHNFDNGVTEQEYFPLKELVIKIAASLKRKVQAHGDAESRNRALADSISRMMSKISEESSSDGPKYQVGGESCCLPTDGEKRWKPFFNVYEVSTGLTSYIKELEIGQSRFKLLLKLGLGVVGGILVTSALIGIMRPWLCSLWEMITGFFFPRREKNVSGVPRRRKTPNVEVKYGVFSEEAAQDQKRVRAMLSTFEHMIDESNKKIGKRYEDGKQDYLYVVHDVKRKVLEPVSIKRDDVEYQAYTTAPFDSLNYISSSSEEAHGELERVKGMMTACLSSIESSNEWVAANFHYVVKEWKKKVFMPIYTGGDGAEYQSNTPVTKARGRDGGAQLQSVDAIPNNIYSNTYKLVASTDDHNFGYGQIMFLCDTLAVQPAHFTKYIKSQVERGIISLDTPMKLVHVTNNAFSVTLDVSRYLSYERSTFSDRDIEFIDFKDLRAHRNVVNNFLSEKQLNYVKGIRGRIDICRMDSDKGVMNFKLITSVLPSFKYGENMRVAGHVLSRYLAYDAVTYVGDCGAPVCILDNSSFSGRACLGIHVAGDQVHGYGYAAIVTKEMVEEAMSKFAVIRDEFAEDIATRNVTYQISDEAPFPNMGSFLPMGVVDRPVSICPKTSYYPVRKMYGEFGEYNYFPAPLSEVYRDGELVYPMVNAVKPYSTEVLVYDKRELTHALHVAMSRFTELTRDSDRHILTFEEAVLGMPERKFRSIPRGTAAGYPYCTEMVGGKKEIFGDGDTYDLTSPKALEFRARCEHVEKKAREGVRCAHIYVDFMKDELRSKAKVDAVATRLISSAPADYTVDWRKYYGAFSAAFMEFHTKTGMAPGICVYTDWHMPANLLSSKGKRVFAGDFKAFDSSEQPSAMEVVLDFVNRWYDDGEENARIRRVLWMDLMHSRHIGGKGRDQRFVYQWNKSLPSGHPFTTIINSIYSLMMIVACYIRATGDRVGFWRHVYTITYGDDNVSNVSDEVSEKFNQVTVAGIMKSAFGLTYTSDVKDGNLEPYTTLDKVTFLKRRFIEEDGWWLCPLELDSFLYSTYWCKNRRMEDKIRVDELENCLEELSMHEQRTWDYYAPKVYAALQRYKFCPNALCYRDMYLDLVRGRSDDWY